MLLISAATARDWIAEVPILLKLTWRNSSPKPSICLFAISLTASGVVSLPVNPVPPVVIMQSISFSFDIDSNVSLIWETSSGIIVL